jgi:hypothetical protein
MSVDEKISALQAVVGDAKSLGSVQTANRETARNR